MINTNCNVEQNGQIERDREAKKGVDIFTSIIGKWNEKNEYYYYECLATTDRFSPYDIQVQKHNIDDWGDIITTYHEIKVRDEKYSYTTFPNSYIDLYKIKQLQKIAYQTEKDVYVNMIYPADSVMLIWKIDPNKKYQTKYVENVDWKSESIALSKAVKIDHKNFVMLPNDTAIKIHY